MIPAPDFSNPDRIISEYKPLVQFFARKYSGCGLSREDLEQEGMLGLLEACQRFDPVKNVRFETYASHWVKKYILQALGRESKHSYNAVELDETALADKSAKPESPETQKLALPSDMPELERRILTLSFEQNKTTRDIAAECNISQEKVRQTRDKALRRLRKSSSS